MSVHQLADLPDVTEGLENRIYTAVHEYNSVNEILFAVKSKRYTLARLRRILICALLNITKEIQNTEPCYARVLGFTNDGAKILKSCTLPVITSVKKVCHSEAIQKNYLKQKFSQQMFFHSL